MLLYLDEQNLEIRTILFLYFQAPLAVKSIIILHQIKSAADDYVCEVAVYPALHPATNTQAKPAKLVDGGGDLLSQVTFLVR